MKNLNSIYILALVSVIFFFSSCNKEEAKIEEPGELITTLTYMLDPDGSTEKVELIFSDVDGDGGNAPIITGGTLTANTNYNGWIFIRNESVTPADEITEEILNEANEHQLFFQPTGLDISIEYTDNDTDGNPLGILTNVQTGDAGSGELTITLRHEPNKNAEGVSTGDITNAGGETDIEVTFPVVIE